MSRLLCTPLTHPSPSAPSYQRYNRPNGCEPVMQRCVQQNLGSGAFAREVKLSGLLSLAISIGAAQNILLDLGPIETFVTVITAKVELGEPGQTSPTTCAMTSFPCGCDFRRQTVWKLSVSLICHLERRERSCIEYLDRQDFSASRRNDIYHTVWQGEKSFSG